MSERFVDIDRETPMLFPADLRDWVPENHLARFIVDVVEQIDTSKFQTNKQGTGSEEYPPQMMIALLIYCYATGRRGSRTIEAATYTDVAVMYICGAKAHPDHSVICDFRTRNREAFKEAFTKVLMLAREVGKLKKVGGISVDGTKIHANASKHSAVSHKRAKEMIATLEGEIEELLKKAEDADSKPLAEGLTIPGEIKRREERKAALSAAVAAMEEEYRAAREPEAETVVKGDEKPSQGGKPLEKYQHNFTDSESRIMKTPGGGFEQCYNAQAAVDTEGSMLILGGYITAHGNDAQELAKVIGSVDEEVRKVTTAASDCGFYNEAAVTEVEAVDENGKRHGPEVFCAVERTGHHRTVKDLEAGNGPRGRIPAGATGKERMARKLRTKRGRAIYKKRKETVEPVFGIIKQVMGFRQFLLRGIEKAGTEWDLITTAYNFKRLRQLLYGESPPFCPVTA